MTIKTKVLHVEKKIAKNGSHYELVHVLITVGGQEFVRQFAIFKSKGA